jgi:hypothetical protein
MSTATVDDSQTTVFTPRAAASPFPMPPVLTSPDPSAPPQPAPLPVRAAPALAEVKPAATDLETARAKGRELRAKSKTFVLEVPIVIGGTVYEHLVLKRPRWVALEKALASPVVQRGQASENLAMISAISGVPIQALADPELGLDLVDGMRLMKEIQDFFPQAQPDKPQLTSEPSSETSPSDGAGIAAS